MSVTTQEMDTPRILLVNMPWVETRYPAFGISLLKGRLSRYSIPCDIAYLNLVWHSIIERELLTCKGGNQALEPDFVERIIQMGTMPWLCAGEWLFSQHYYGMVNLDTDQFLTFLFDTTKDTPFEEVSRCFEQLTELVPLFFDKCVTLIDWQKYSLVGFSSVFSQQMASLCLARILKRKFHHLGIIFGGGNCHGVMGEELIRNYEFIDYVFTGEADESLPKFINTLKEGNLPEGVKGLIWRHNGRTINNGPSEPVRNLNKCSYPDYKDYFQQYKTNSLSSASNIRILIEASRGCWWGTRSQCIFCGLNGPYLVYRQKDSGRTLGEIKHFLKQYPADYIAFTDTIFSPEYFNTLLPRMAETVSDVTFACEIKSNLTRQQAQLLSRAGFKHVQPGIESLSTPILNIMRKGATALENVACLKYCREAGIQVGWNLLYGFPREDPEEYANILETLKRLTHLSLPFSVGSMSLVRYSPAFNEGSSLGFVNIRPFDIYRQVYPFEGKRLDNLSRLFSFDYADGRNPESYVKPIKDFVALWKRKPNKGDLIYEPKDDGTAIVHDTRFNRKTPKIYLDFLQRSIYEYCDEIRSFFQIEAFVKEKFDGFSTYDEEIRKILDFFYDHYLMVHEDNSYLSIAMMNCELVPWLAIAYLSL